METKEKIRTCIGRETLRVLACPGQIEGALCDLHDAAPELLKALKLLLVSNDALAWAGACIQAEAAIAKAESRVEAHP